MAIEAMSRADRVPKVKAICDDCQRDEVLTCDYDHRGMNWFPDVGQARKKLGGKGWTFVKGVDRCPSCEAKRKAFKPKEQTTEQQKEPEVTNVTELRKPSREQRRAIIALLDEVYDAQAGRYKGTETDVTVAEAIGGGVMFGWVAEIRVENFGDSGDNEESGKLAADLAALMDQAAAAQKLATEAQKLATEAQNAASALKLEVSRALDRVNAMAKSLGPKGRVVS